MTHIKTAELNHNALSYIVSMIEMPHLVWGKTIGIHYVSNHVVIPELSDCYSPFTTWAMCGPIIDREGIQLNTYDNADLSKKRSAAIQTNKGNVIIKYGPTSLIAAMRCFVASKLGEEVEIPQEILE